MNSFGNVFHKCFEAEERAYCICKAGLETKWYEISLHLDFADVSFCKLCFYVIFVSLSVKQRTRKLSGLTHRIIWRTSESVIAKDLYIIIVLFGDSDNSNLQIQITTFSYYVAETHIPVTPVIPV